VWGKSFAFSVNGFAINPSGGSMKNLPSFLLIGLPLLVLLAACAHLQAPVSVEQKGGVIEMTASDFKFEPNNIAARTGDTITFRIHNVTGATHNFTLKSPDSSVMQSVDIPPKGSVDVKAAFSKAGTYHFYCNKTGHSELGMKGQVVAAGD
jgi:plastocyanin